MDIMDIIHKYPYMDMISNDLMNQDVSWMS